MNTKTAVIIGAGPAGLTAAYELLARTDITPLVLEMSDYVGGISRTVNYKGNRIDIGGHRFFSKSDRVMDWWLRMMPLQKRSAAAGEVIHRQTSRQLETTADGPDPDATDRVMLVRRRKSRIYFLRKLFDYPLRLNADTIAKLGSRGRSESRSVTRGRRCLQPRPRRTWRSSSSVVSAKSFISHFLSRTRKRFGEKAARGSARNGAPKESRGYRSAGRCGISWAICSDGSAMLLVRRLRRLRLSKSFFIPNMGRGKCGRSSPTR